MPRLRPTIDKLRLMSSAVILLGALALASVAGTYFPQNLPFAAYEGQFGTFWAKVFALLGAPHIYASWWYLGALAILLISVALCIKGHARQFWRGWRVSGLSEQAAKKWRVQFQVKKDMQYCEQALRAAGFKPFGNDGETCFFIRGRLSRLGYFFTHIGILLLAFAGLLSGVIGFRATMNLYPHEVDDRALIFHGDDATIKYLPFKVKNEDFSINYYASGQPKHYETVLGVGSITRTVSVNNPLSYKGYTFYQASFGDAGSRLVGTLLNLQSGERFTVAGQVHQSLSTPNESCKLELLDFKRHLTAQNVNENEAVPTMRDMGAVADYSVSGPASEAMKLRTYVNRPGVIAVADGEGNMQPVLLGLGAEDKLGWQVVTKALAQGVESDENFRAFAAPVLKRNLPENQRVAVALKSMQAFSVLKNLDVPCLLFVHNYDERLYTGLQVAYDPGAKLFALASLLLVLGIFAMGTGPYTVIALAAKRQRVTVSAKGRTDRSLFEDLRTKLEG